MSLAATVLLALVRRMKKGGIIIAEHTLTSAQTRFHVEVLRRWFDFLKLEELPHRLAHPGPRPFCLLTFDDGKRSNFSQAAPELERLGVPAVFYLPTEFVTKRSYLWFDRREQLLRALGCCPPGLELEVLKTLPLDCLTDRLARACAGHELRLPENDDHLRPMSWADARNLHRRGFALGAHGVSHAILTRETKPRAFAEIEESLAKVSSELDAPCVSFAFPNGNYTPELARHARRCGAQTVMTCDPMWASPLTPSWRLPRVQLFPNLSRGRIELKLAISAFPGVLANPDGSGRGYRTLARQLTPAN